VPTAQVILNQLSTISQQWWPLAVAWHIYIATLIVALFLGWRPSRRVASVLISMPVASAMALALVSVNPLTTVLLGGTLVGTQLAVWRFASEPARTGNGLSIFVGGALVAFGLIYPHFLNPSSYVAYLYAAPIGLVPCPTLAVLIGFSIALGSLGSKLWAIVVAAAGLAYGMIGALYLGVRLDWVLAAGALVVLMQALWPKAFEANGISAA
jgi:hypothetical protein